MKKFLTVLGVSAILLTSAPVMASPHGPGGPDRIHVEHRAPRHPHGGHYGAPPPPPPAHYRHSRPQVSVGWGVARRGYWTYPGRCDYRLGWYDDYYDLYCRPIRVRPNVGVYIGF